MLAQRLASPLISATARKDGIAEIYVGKAATLTNQPWGRAKHVIARP
jgi:hypothetical protein